MVVAPSGNFCLLARLRIAHSRLLVAVGGFPEFTRFSEGSHHFEFTLDHVEQFELLALLLEGRDLFGNVTRLIPHLSMYFKRD